MKRLLAAAVLFLSAAAGWGDALPGFRVELLGSTAGFLSSLAVDSRGTIYYTTTSGSVFRVTAGQSVEVARVNTVAIGDSGLLGMALIDDQTAVVHYTTPNQTDDVVSTIDLATGEEKILQRFVADISLPGRASPPEHHGGNPSVAADGSIFVGIGDYGGGLIASLPEWNGGKIFRITRDGRAEQFARGFRNPFDMAWDDEHQRLVVPDNGPVADDEINVITQGDYCGWPFTSGSKTGIDGATPPVYVFPTIVAPTGIIAANGRNAMLRSGYLLAAFVAKAIFFIPDIDARPLEPIALIKGETGFLIDVAQAANGDVYFGTGNALYRLVAPARGDCNGDGKIDADDMTALLAEVADGGAHKTMTAQGGKYKGSWGCDVNGDGVIDEADIAALRLLLIPRPRPTRR